MVEPGPELDRFKEEITRKLKQIPDDRGNPLRTKVYELPPGEPGEIILQTPTMMMGYYNRPQETPDPIQGAVGDRVPLRTA